MQKIKSGFTLVELLIVVVIIGILSAALLPRLTGHMARTRDLKRQTDLRNIATAIGMYKNNKGSFPLRTIYGEEKARVSDMNNKYLAYYGYVSALKESLGEYLRNIPKDPLSSNRNLMHLDAAYANEKETSTIINQWKPLRETAMRPGEYHYQLFFYQGIKYAGGVLVAKVETADSANYVFTELPKEERFNRKNWHISQYRRHPARIFDHGANPEDWDIVNLHLCDQLSKTQPGDEKKATAEDHNCRYSSTDQLYYIVLMY